MRVILRYDRVISIDPPTLPLPLSPEEEIAEAPDYVERGWYRRPGDMWIPPQKGRSQ